MSSEIFLHLSKVRTVCACKLSKRFYSRYWKCSLVHWHEADRELRCLETVSRSTQIGKLSAALVDHMNPNGEGLIYKSSDKTKRRAKDGAGSVGWESVWYAQSPGLHPEDLTNWWYLSVIPALKRQIQADRKFKLIPGYIRSLTPVWKTWDTTSKEGGELAERRDAWILVIAVKSTCDRVLAPLRNSPCPTQLLTPSLSFCTSWILLPLLQRPISV